MEKLKSITMEEAVRTVTDNNQAEAEVKTPTGKIIDHGRICALYTANPPRSVKWIADDMGITQQTVINHLKKEGIYKKEG